MADSTETFEGMGTLKLAKDGPAINLIETNELMKNIKRQMDLESLTSGEASEQELRLNDDVNGPSDHPQPELASPQMHGSKLKKANKRQRPRFEDIEKMELD